MKEMMEKIDKGMIKFAIFGMCFMFFGALIMDLSLKEELNTAETNLEVCNLKLAVNTTNASIYELQLDRCIGIANQLAQPIVVKNQTTNESFCCTAVGNCKPM